MSLSAGQRIAELSPSRLAVVLFVDCFERLPQLKLAPAFWACAVPHVSDPRREPGLLVQLLRALPRAELAPYAPELGLRLLSTDALEAAVKSVQRRVLDGGLAVEPRSLVGALCCDQAALLDTLDLFAVLAVWRNLAAAFAPFARALGHEQAAQSMQQLLGPGDSVLRSGDSVLQSGDSVLPSGDSVLRPAACAQTRRLDPMANLENRDVEATLDSFYRALDTRAPRACTQQLAVIYESFGHVDAALQAQSQAFASERRRLIGESKRADAVAPPADAHTRGMVSWLHHTLAFNARTARVPPELDLRRGQIQDYLRQTAASPDERAEVASIDMNEALDAGARAELLLATALQMIELYASHAHARNSLVQTCTFHLLLSIMWFRLGRRLAAHSHAALARAAASGSGVASLRAHLLADLAFCHGFEFGDLVEGACMLADAASAQRFDEGVQFTRSLLFAGLYVRAHNFEAARNLLEELDDVPLNKFQARAKQALQLRLMLGAREHYAAYVYAGECVRQLPDEETRGHHAIYFRLAGVRALVLSQDPLNAIEARCWIGECLAAARQLGYANFVLEAALLEARLFYNEGDFRSCYVLCQALEHDARANPNARLYCEWLLLNAASTQLCTGEFVDVDPEPFRLALYTEFGDVFAAPRAAARCLRPRAAVSVLHDAEAENPMSDVLTEMLEGRLEVSDFRTAITASYAQLVEAQSRLAPADETPSAQHTASELSVERGSFISPPRDKETRSTSTSASASTSTPQAGARLNAAALTSPPGLDDEISVPKRLRPLSGSPRKGRKRRSMQLD